MKRLSQFLGYASGNLISSGTTYIALLYFAYVTDITALGKYALLTAFAAIVVSFLDSVIHQRTVANIRSTYSSPPVTATPAKIAVMLMAIVAIYLVVSPVLINLIGREVSLALLLYCVGQAGYVGLTTAGVFLPAPKDFFWQQARHGLILVVVLTATYISDTSFGLVGMLTQFGFARVFSSTLELFIGFLSAKRWRKAAPLGAIYDALWSKRVRRGTVQMAFRQMAIVLSTQLDTIGASAGGVAESGRYQLMQRPMLALSVANVSLDQSATRQAIAGIPFRWVSFLKASLLLAVVWPAMGLITGTIIQLISPAEAAPPISGTIVLAFAYTFAGLAAYMGPWILVQGREKLLLFTSIVKLLVLGGSVIPLSAAFGITGTALSVLFAKLSVVGCYLWGYRK